MVRWWTDNAIGSGLIFTVTSAFFLLNTFEGKPFVLFVYRMIQHFGDLHEIGIWPMIYLQMLVSHCILSI